MAPTRNPLSDALGGALAGLLSGLPFLVTGGKGALILAAFYVVLIVCLCVYAINRKTKASHHNLDEKSNAN